MNKRKLLISLLVAGLFTAGLGAGVFPAAADQRTFQVTFVGGTTTIVSLDVPAGTPLDQISIPGVSLPILSIQDITPPASTAPAQTTPVVPPASDDGQSDDQQAAPEPVAKHQSEQKTTGDKNRKAQVETETQSASDFLCFLMARTISAD